MNLRSASLPSEGKDSVDLLDPSEPGKRKANGRMSGSQDKNKIKTEAAKKKANSLARRTQRAGQATKPNQEGSGRRNKKRDRREQEAAGKAPRKEKYEDFGSNSTKL